jgi:hypothetical protein
MRPLLCSDPLSPRQPDEAYQVELAAGDRDSGPTRMAVRLAQRPLGCDSFNPSDALGHRTKRGPEPCQPPTTSPS